jgi:methylmalonyl-CoA mutase N-terminal domain/subunit
VEERLKIGLAQWQSRREKAAAKVPERCTEVQNFSGIPVKGLYTPLDWDDTSFEEKVGFPGDYPYTRGVQAAMYRSRLWTMRQYAGFGGAEETNARFRYLLEQGQTGLSVAFDLPTQIGYDSDHPLSAGEVGKVGVAIDSLADMEVLFQEIPLDKVSTSMTINAPAVVLLAMYAVVGEKQGVDFASLRGTIQNDILKEYMARGTYIFPPRQSMRLTTDIFAWCKKEMPQWNTISISGYHIREAGSTAVQELAFTLADGIAYVQAAIDAGLSVDEFAPRLSFFFNSQMDLFEEIAKFRAARRLWAKIMRDRFKAKDSRSMMLRFHTQTAGAALTAQQPDNNVPRVTLQALAAVLGGTQSLHTNSRDEALALPSQEAVRLALRTQQVIAFESGVTETVDPLAGSYYVEAMTDNIEAEALAYITKIDELGGAVAAVEQGFMQREIQDSAYRWQKAVEDKERIVVGVNSFQVDEAEHTGLLRVNAEVEKKQRRGLIELRKARAGAAVEGALLSVRQAAESGVEIMPSIIEAVRVYATVGEICDEMRRVFGEYQPDTIL